MHHAYFDIFFKNVTGNILSIKILRDLPFNILEFNGHLHRYARFLHGNSVHYIGNAHGHLVVGNYEKLRVFGKFLQDVGKPIYVALIQGGICLVQDAEWAGF